MFFVNKLMRCDECGEIEKINLLKFVKVRTKFCMQCGDDTEFVSLERND